MAATEMILALNCGSSSIKFKLFQLSDLKLLISGSASRVDSRGQNPAIKLIVYHSETEKHESESEEEKEGMEYDAVFQRCIELIEASSSKHFESGDVKAKDVIKLVAHRVVHGGNEKEPFAIWPGHEDGLEKLDKLGEFAPLHNHRAIQVVKSCLEHLPNSRQVLLFDTLFHQTLPEHIYTYPLSAPSEAPPIPLRKYGAHGLSYANILTSMSSHLCKPKPEINIIIAHLGSGASVCCIRDGKSYDTSMGLTPLDGLPGGSRTGSVDPVLIFHHTPAPQEFVEFKGTKLSKGEMVLNKEGGFLALSGTNDFGTITTRAKSSPDDNSISKEQRESAKLTYDLFIDRIVNYVGAYVFKILSPRPSPDTSSGEEGEAKHAETGPDTRKLDGIVLSGGIGEKGAQFRKDLGLYFSWLGLKVDDKRNQAVGKGDGEQKVYEISEDGSKLKMFVCLTDEETQCAMMAKEYK